MLTTTAKVLLTLTMTMTPTTVPTYTVQEQALYDKGFNAGAQKQFCVHVCTQAAWEKKQITKKRELDRTFTDIRIHLGEFKIDHTLENQAKENYQESLTVIKNNKCNCDDLLKKEK